MKIGNGFRPQIYRIGEEAGIGLLGGFIDGAFGLAQQKKQHQYEQENMALENQYQLEQWRRENAYNSPQAVAQRYKEAGVNPYAVLSGGNTGAGIAGSFGSPPSASTSASAVSTDFAGVGQNIATISMQQRQLEEQKRFNDAEIAQKDAHTSAVLTDNLTRAESNLLKLEQQRADISKTLSETGKNEQEIAESKARIKEIDQRIDVAKQNIELMKQQINESKSRQGLNTANTAKVQEETKTIQSQRDALLDKIESDTDLSKSQKTYYRELANKVEKEWEYVIKEVESYDLVLKAKLAQMTSSELRGWFDVLAEFKKLKNDKSYKNMSEKEKNRANKIFFLKTILPLLLK